VTITTLVIAAIAFVAFNGLSCFNTKFRDRFFGTLWRTRYIFAFVAAIYFLLPAIIGPSASHSILSMLPSIILQFVMAIVFVGFQFGMMFWMMGNANKPEVYLPGDAPTKEWSDWIGSEGVKKELQKAVESLRRWELYEKNGTKPLNGMLLYGPPGTGKSLAAKVVASQAGLPVVIASAASLNGPFMGMGMLLVRGLSRRVKKLARKYGGCVVFLDEIDAIGATRSGLGGGMGMPMGGMGGFMGGGMGGNGTLQSLLTVMSGAEGGETFLLKLRKRWGLAKRDKKHTWRILWMAATNVALETLDPALIRSGRFGSKKLAVNAPNDDNRRALFNLYLRKKNVADDLDFDQLVQLSRGMTGADIEEVCEAAMRTIIFEGSDRPLAFADMFAEIRLHKNGVPRSVPLHEKERYPIAVHEAGHGTAVVLYPPAGMLCSGATLTPTEDFLGAVMFERVEELSLMMKEDCYRRVLIAVASRAAEKVVLNDASAGVSSDLNQAMSMALAMVEHYGMGDRLTSAAAIGGGHSPRAVEQAEDIVNATYEVAERLIDSNQNAVKALADSLVAEVNLTGPQVIDLVMQHAQIPFESVAAEVEGVVARLKLERKTRHQSTDVAPKAGDTSEVS